MARAPSRNFIGGNMGKARPRSRGGLDMDPDDIGGRRQMPDYGIEVGDPAELQDFGGGVGLDQLVDLNPQAFGNTPGTLPPKTDEDPFYRNLLDDLGDMTMNPIVVHLDQQIEIDAQARKNFDTIVARGIQETGFDRMNDQRTTPFAGASAVVHPLMAQASTDFSSRAIKQLYPPKGPVKTEIVGDPNEESMKRARKVKRFMNWVLKVRCKGYRIEAEKMLAILPYAGDCVKKLTWDRTESGFGRPKSEFVLPDKFITPYATSDLEETPRFCHELDLFRETVASYMDSKFWKKVALPTGGDRMQRSQQKEKTDRIQGKQEPIDLNKDTMAFREVYVDWYFPKLQKENDGAKQAAAGQADQQKAQGAEQPREPGAAEGAFEDPAQQPALPPTGEDGEMVDLAAGLDGARAQQQQGPAPSTDLDSVETDEMKKEPVKTVDDRDRVDAVQQGGFPAGPKLPYIITYHRESKTPVAVYRNWKKSDVNQKKRVWFSHYVMFHWRGWNGIGLWHMIGGLAKSATGALRALMDSAVIDNLPGGVRLANTRLSGEDISYRPMEFAKISAAGIDDIRKAVMPYPKNPTSPVLLELLQLIVGWAGNFATTATQDLMELAPNTPATSVLQVLEHSSAVYSAIHARLHLAQEHEFQLLAELIAENLPEEGFKFDDDEGEDIITAEDFKGVKIKPVSDPETFSEMQRSVRNQAALALVKEARAMGVKTDVRLAVIEYAQSLGLENCEKLFPEDSKAIPLDPLSELMAVMKGRPVDAFPGQNHKAHVAFLKAAAQNPQYQSMIEGIMPQFMALGQAHTIRMLRDELEQAAGGQLPFGAKLDPSTAAKLAIKAAELMTQLTKNVMENGVDPILGKAMDNDPIMQLAQAEREKVIVMREEAQLKRLDTEDKLEAELAKLAAEIEHEERKMMFSAEMEMNKLIIEMQVKLTVEFAKIEAKSDVDAAKLATQIADNVRVHMNTLREAAEKRRHETMEETKRRIHERQLALIAARSKAKSGGAEKKTAA